MLQVARRRFLKLIPFILLLTPISISSQAQALEATVEANGFSFSFSPAATSDGLTIFFTTFDGSSGTPLQDCVGNFCTISQELAPSFVGSTTYRADYIVADSTGVFEYGTVTVATNTRDSDGNGTLDALELAKSGNFAFAGTAVPDFNAFGIFVNSSVQGSVVRGSGSRVGTYSGRFANPSRAPTFSGAMALSGAAGPVTYQLGGPTLNWFLSMTGIDGTNRNFTGVSEIDRIGTTAIEIPSFSLFDSGSGLSLFVQATTLIRSGNIYRGSAHVVDGEPLTSWQDYTDFRVEFTDTNDTDMDGVPDISSVPEPSANLLSLAAVGTLTLLSRRHGLRENLEILNEPAGST